MSTDTGLITIASAAYLAPPAASGKYLTDQPYLFQPVSAQGWAPRIPYTGQARNLHRETVGPTRDYVAVNPVSWKWRNRGGDWVGPPPGLVPMAPVWWSSVLTPALGVVAAAYKIDMTVMAQHCQVNNRWMAFLISCGGSRIISAKLGTQPPTLTCRYTDGTSETMPLWLIAGMATGSVVPSTLTATANLPAVMEFKKPSKPVASATLDFLVTAHSTSTSTIGVLLLDPPLNTDGLRHGVAAAGPLDATLPSDPSIIGVHRYVDGWKLPDFLAGSFNINADNAYDPSLWGGARNLAKLPNVGVGKWLAGLKDNGHGVFQQIDNFGKPEAEWQPVDSTFTGDGYVPLAPGMGALRLKMFKGVDITTGEPVRDGSVVGYTGSGAAATAIPLPPAEFCTLQEIYTRYYLLIGTPGGASYVADPAERFNVYNGTGATGATWTDRGGKMGLTPVHATSFGGLSGSAGGGNGWQMRHSWADTDELFGGPMEGGWRVGIHMYDFQYANPAGYNFGAESPTDHSFAQRGGRGGVFYAGRWYCVEMRTKLNSIDKPARNADGSPHVINGVQQFWTPDGEVEVWIDGVRAYLRTGLVMRTLPIMTPADYPGVWNPAIQVRPLGNLGHKFVWLNWYHGGLTRVPVDMVSFYTGLAWGRNYIGPMRPV